MGEKARDRTRIHGVTSQKTAIIVDLLCEILRT